jgi:hypothetical protein
MSFFSPLTCAGIRLKPNSTMIEVNIFAGTVSGKISPYPKKIK